MFTAFSKVLSYFWAMEEDSQGEETVPEDENPEYHFGLRDDSNTDHKGSNSACEKSNAGSSSIKYVNGVVTHLFNLHGLIDDEIYFSFDKIIAESVPGVGDRVSVTARRKHQHSGWFAEQVCVASVPDWEICNEGAQKKDTTTGMITEYRDNKGIINNKMIFTGEHVVEHYTPVAGDHVTVDLKVHGGSTHISNIRPRRMVEKDGVITAIRKGYGYIGEGILFSFDSCQEGFRPRKGEKVKVAAIESKQGQCQWRALAVKPPKEVQVRLNIQALSGNGLAFTQKMTNTTYVPPEYKRRYYGKGFARVAVPSTYNYHLPEYLKVYIERGEDPGKNFPVLKEELDLLNFSEKMSLLLHLEEIERIQIYKQFSMKRVEMKKEEPFLVIQNPGLSEHSQDLVLGDIAKVKPSDADTDEMSFGVECFIEKVEKDEIFVTAKSHFFNKYNGEEVDIEFFPCRSPIVKQHRVVAAMVDERRKKLLELDQRSQTRVLSKQKWHTATELRLARLGRRDQHIPYTRNSRQNRPQREFFNQRLNMRQRDTVSRIVDYKGTPPVNPPYVIFGPPGTGKSVTLVEIVMQLLAYKENSRILLCSETNSACDTVTKMLLRSEEDWVTDSLVRVIAITLEEEKIPEDILPYSKTLGSKEDVDFVQDKRLVICTLGMAATLTKFLEMGHFTHSIVDEAGTATEPQSCAPMCLIDTRLGGQVILAGDPHQLGPVVLSKWASFYGLKTSFLGRLLGQPEYKRNTKFPDNYDPMRVTKLVENYRSHESILKMPSQLFYDDELECKGDKKEIHSLCDWKELPSPGFPVIFHGVKGGEAKEADGTSWCNPQEAMVVAQYLGKLLHDQSLGLTEDDIGIITPYLNQVNVITRMINLHGMEEVMIGPVEKFQGQEKKVIILSTVRSDEELSSRSIKASLGFIACPQRFNTALTRAKSLLIVVGNPRVLAKNEYWGALLLYCLKNKACTGYGISEEDVQKVQEESREIGNEGNTTHWSELESKTRGYGDDSSEGNFKNFNSMGETTRLEDEQDKDTTDREHYERKSRSGGEFEDSLSEDHFKQRSDRMNTAVHQSEDADSEDFENEDFEDEIVSVEVFEVHKDQSGERHSVHQSGKLVKDNTSIRIKDHFKQTSERLETTVHQSEDADLEEFENENEDFEDEIVSVEVFEVHKDQSGERYSVQESGKVVKDNTSIRKMSNDTSR